MAFPSVVSQGASAAEKALGWITRIPGRFLEATDQFFRGKAESAEALRLATEKIGRGAGWEQREISEADG